MLTDIYNKYSLFNQIKYCMVLIRNNTSCSFIMNTVYCLKSLFDQNIISCNSSIKFIVYELQNIITLKCISCFFPSRSCNFLSNHSTVSLRNGILRKLYFYYKDPLYGKRNVHWIQCINIISWVCIKTISGKVKRFIYSGMWANKR